MRPLYAANPRNRCDEVASRQHGVISRCQGFQRLVAALLWAGEDAALSHSTSAALLELDGFHRETIEVSIIKGMRSPAPWLVVHRVKTFGVADVAEVDGMRVTSPARTVDLAGQLDQSGLLNLIDDCIRRKLFSVTRLRWQARQTGRTPGLPSPELQYAIHDGKSFVARVDFCYPDKKLVIEADGRWFHFGDSAFEKDRPRRNALESLGWRVLQFTWRDLVERPDKVIATIARALSE